MERTREVYISNTGLSLTGEGESIMITEKEWQELNAITHGEITDIKIKVLEILLSHKRYKDGKD